MRLAGLRVRNYRRIGVLECTIRIDEIVVLIGPNNSGKSTVLDAYEAFASSGKELDESHFHTADPLAPIEITGVFTELSAEDIDTLGKKWLHADPEYGDCIKVRWIWKKPGEKAQKQSFDPGTQAFEDGGVGGWDSLLQSRIPQPVRIKPTDPVETTQTKIVSMLKEHVKARLKADSKSTKAAFDELEKLTKQIFVESKAAFDDVAGRITTAVSEIFPGTTIELVPRSKDNLDEKVVGADSYLKVGTAGNTSTPLMLQGTGLQRALLWSALSVMSDSPGAKKKQKGAGDIGRILLIDEPEAFLHPPTIRSARDSLYDFALNNPDWQVVATTHSPIFIDLSRDHTTIVRVDPAAPDQHYVSTDKMSFDADERTRLQMVRACNSMVNEFFFYDNIVLVEGPTEQIAVQHVASKVGTTVHVINCLGKANIPLFARILNQFQVPYLVIHDSDTPKVLRKKMYIDGAMWTMNKNIRIAVSERHINHVFTQFPHFEGEFLDEELVGGKVDRVLELLADPTSADYARMFDAYSRVLQRDPKLMTTTEQDFNAKRDYFINAKCLAADPSWA
jgi:putative ATP-dependent endonuclease of the OLD family